MTMKRMVILHGGSRVHSRPSHMCRTKPGEIDTQARLFPARLSGHSTRIPAAFTTFAHFAISLLMFAAHSSGELPIGKNPRSTRRGFTSGACTTLAMAALNVLIAVCGVPEGASETQ